MAPPIPYLGMVYYPIIHPLSNHTFQEWVDDAQRFSRRTPPIMSELGKGVVLLDQ